MPVDNVGHGTGDGSYGGHGLVNRCKSSTLPLDVDICRFKKVRGGKEASLEFGLRSSQLTRVIIAI